MLNEEMAQLLREEMTPTVVEETSQQDDSGEGAGDAASSKHSYSRNAALSSSSTQNDAASSRAASNKSQRPRTDSKKAAASKPTSSSASSRQQEATQGTSSTTDAQQQQASPIESPQPSDADVKFRDMLSALSSAEANKDTVLDRESKAAGLDFLSKLAKGKTTKNQKMINQAFADRQAADKKLGILANKQDDDLKAKLAAGKKKKGKSKQSAASAHERDREREEQETSTVSDAAVVHELAHTIAEMLGATEEATGQEHKVNVDDLSQQVENVIQHTTAATAAAHDAAASGSKVGVTTIQYSTVREAYNHAIEFNSTKS